MTISEQAISEVLEIVKSSKEFVLEQAPEVCKEIIRWGVGLDIILIVLSLLSLRLSIWIYKSHVKGTTWRDDNEGWVVFAIFSGLFFFIALPFSIMDLVKIFVAPKLYILDYLKPSK